ncbi:LysR family transcriptional regulator [Aliigemmobacter aestuarii]|uniref:LysR family transcriptional regulator n=1 Tax=Aliigemmobacter aestuarii TaxID=1445661 RepID=A0A4S3MME8_9RHOB|nr:LysR substrate-binding domain-containing protein [Gemmobacter aestuarii]THD82851.1 LysR family transcriptional regulator [Gemmobacter aestuarii]
MHPAIKLRHIRAFLDIAASGSLSAVARSQGITQPALSRTLAELESLLGTPLFRREGRRLILTEQGALFRHHARLAIAALEAAADALHPGTGEARIRAGILPTVAARLFPRVALRFRDLNPSATLTVETGPHPYLMRRLREGGIDLIIGRMPAAAEIGGLSFEHLYDDPILLVARRGHPMAAQPPAEALSTCPVILPPADAVIRAAVDGYLAALGLAGMRPAWETVAPSLGRGLVLGSDALWFISRGVVADDLDRGAMIALPHAASYLSGAVGITRRQGTATPGALDLLVQITRGMVTEGAALRPVDPAINPAIDPGPA